MYTCRECEKPVNQATEVCPYCGADLSPAVDETAKPGSAGKRIVVWGTMIAAVWAFLWFILPERSTGVAAQAEAAALRTVEEVSSALRTHRETNGSYPSNLDGLTAAAYGRVREAARRAQAEGYRMDFAPGPAGEGGNIQTFALVIRPANYGFRSFFVNETGVVRATTESRAASVQDPPVSERK